MSAITRFFFRNEITCRTPAEVIGWWEGRRLPFNIAVGTAGLVTLAAVHVIARIPPLPVAIPLDATVAIAGIYGFMANLCYSAGWAVELLVRRLLGREMEPVGPALFRYGFVFSIGLTLIPIAIITVAKASLLIRALT
ncbi:MAG TPA: hypothetical protein VF981_05635 [Gemmatimonadaceae bacterium]